MQSTLQIIKGKNFLEYLMPRKFWIEKNISSNLNRKLRFLDIHGYKRKPQIFLMESQNNFEMPLKANTKKVPKL